MGPGERLGWAAGPGSGRGVTRLSPAPRWQLITEQADIPLSRGAEMKGKCGTNESELEISWLERAYTLKLFFLKVRGCPRRLGRGRCAAALRGPDQPCPPQEGHNTSRGPEAFWRLSRIQFAYDTSERTYFKDAVSRKRPGNGAAKRVWGPAEWGREGTHPPDDSRPGAATKPRIHFSPFILYLRFESLGRAEL